MHCLGIDTSNYTTSAAVYDTESGQARRNSRLLPVKSGELGLRQSDAVFEHTRQLPQVLGGLFTGEDFGISAVGVSLKPRDAEGSYMPCFLAGASAAKAFALGAGVPLYGFSHQAGHIAAALYDTGLLDLCHTEFLALHISGGTTEALLVRPDADSIIFPVKVGGTLDLNAGQLIDRVGRLLGLPFPSGSELDSLAQKHEGGFNIPAPSFNGLYFNLSGAENKIADFYTKCGDRTAAARYTIEYILKYLEILIDRLQSAYGSLPVVCAGGVMSNSIIRPFLEQKYNAVFASPALSSDNAVGIAVLAACKAEKR